MLQKVAKLILKNAVGLAGLVFSTLVLCVPEHCLLSGLRPPSLRKRVIFPNVDAHIFLNPLPMKLVPV